MMPSGRFLPLPPCFGLRAVAAGLVLGGVLLLLPAAVLAQGDYLNPGPVTDPGHFGSFQACMNRYALPPELAPDRPQGIRAFQSPLPVVENALECANAFAGGEMRVHAQPFYYGLMIIVVVWTGVQVMLSGRFDFGEVLSLVLLLGFISMLWHSYPVPLGGPPPIQPIWWAGGSTLSFPLWVGSLGRFVADDLVAGTWEQVGRTWRNGTLLWRAEAVVAESMEVACQASRSNEDALREAFAAGIWDTQACEDFRSMSSARGATLAMFLLYMLLGLLFGAVPLLVAFFSYLWGYFSLTIATIMGPLFIPFGLLPQTSFLLWGWIRAIIASTVQMMVGGAVFVITGSLLIVPIQRYLNSLGELMGTGAQLSAGEVMGRGMGSLVEFFPLAIIAMLGAFKAGELTSMILSGGGVPSSGIGQRAQGARSAGRAAGSAVRGVGAMGGMAGGAVAGMATGGAAMLAGAGRAAMSAVTRRK